jgi:hypothetical protein
MEYQQHNEQAAAVAEEEDIGGPLPIQKLEVPLTAPTYKI